MVLFIVLKYKDDQNGKTFRQRDELHHPESTDHPGRV